MMKIWTLAVLLLGSAFAKAQIVINELDADTESTDTLEFIELKTDNPFESLDGYIMVLFNGSSSTTTGQGRAYFVEDLDGLTSDENGLVVIGMPRVSPVPERIFFNDNFQNGADAVGIYLGEPADFPEGNSFATTTNLIDALVYDTSDPDNQNLLNLLGESVQYNENENGNKDFESLQRKNDGTYEAKVPTPFSLNDAVGLSYVGVGYATSTDEITEGQSFDITFTLTEVQPQDLVLNFTLDNGGYDSSDYTGATQVTILANTLSTTLTFNTIDDSLDEGDEFLQINIQNNLPQGFKRLNDNEQVLVIDNDFVVASYGTPLNPTYGIVASTAPSNYYDSLDGLSGQALGDEITAIIADPSRARIHTYSDVTDILKEADKSPLNSNQVWLMYTEQQRPIRDFQDSGGSSVGLWNREHIYPRSRGDFFGIEYDDIADGINVFTESRADSLRHGYSDAHHLRATDGPENSSRGNSDYPEYNGPAGSQGSWHGDVARALFYMDLRYNGLDLVNGNPSDSTVGQLGDLATLIQWHRDDPADDFEMNRNNVIFNWQNNRNPFIDIPELAEFIYGNQSGQTFTLSNATESLVRFTLYPNPSHRSFKIDGLEDRAELVIFDLAGRKVLNKSVGDNQLIHHNLPAGSYLINIISVDSRATLKLQVAR
ncbi:endonuclease I [Nonlabens spongiae]|uniref:Endonuclease I n=1 Tax=Nonlabens spongiae TaxID=331648 RepID=A0A1W6MP34_9FLAO|nr:endonuclease [Nonlabens spongiae]ARN79374.1 endonuclease I [Nonlabens spongiae]